MKVTVDMAVMGAGLAGLVLAKALAEKGFSVALVEKRAKFLRGQMLNEYSAELRYDLWDCSRMLLPKGENQIKDVQREMMRFVRSAAEHYRSSDVVRKGRVHLYQPYEAVAVNRTEHTATIRSVKDDEEVTLRFKHIFCCAGAHHPVLNLIKDHPVRYSPTFQQMVEPNVGVLQLRLPDRMREHPELLLDIVSPTLSESLRYFSGLQDPDHEGVELPAWSRMYMPIVHKKPHPNPAKITLVCSLPDVVVNEVDLARKQRLLIAWGRKAAVWAYSRYPALALTLEEVTAMAPSKKHGPEKDALRVMATNMTFHRADRIGFPLEPGSRSDESRHMAFVVGDAFATIPYMLGEGSAVAMWQALILIKHLDSAGHFDAKACQVEIDSFMSAVWRHMNSALLEQQRGMIEEVETFCRAASMYGESEVALKVAPCGFALVALFRECESQLASPAKAVYMRAIHGVMRILHNLYDQESVLASLKRLRRDIHPPGVRLFDDLSVAIDSRQARQQVVVQLKAIEDKLSRPTVPLHTPAEIRLWNKAGFDIGDDGVPVERSHLQP